MREPFIDAMRQALNRILNADSPDERKAAEDAMAQLIRGSRKSARPAEDWKAKQSQNDD